jgi:hypothetical protein
MITTSNGYAGDGSLIWVCACLIDVLVDGIRKVLEREMRFLYALEIQSKPKFSHNLNDGLVTVPRRSLVA